MDDKVAKMAQAVLENAWEAKTAAIEATWTAAKVMSGSPVEETAVIKAAAQAAKTAAAWAKITTAWFDVAKTITHGRMSSPEPSQPNAADLNAKPVSGNGP